MAHIRSDKPGPRQRVTRGQWPPTVGDLVVRSLAESEPCPPGWTERPASPTAGTARCAWRIWTGTETGIGGDPDVAIAFRGEPGGAAPWTSPWTS